MIAVLLAYKFYAPVEDWLTKLAAIKAQWGYGFSFLSAAIAGGVLPEILTVLVFQRGRMQRANLNNIVFGFLFWGSQGVLVDAFYRLQARTFGSHDDFATVAKKVLVDQFVFTPFVSNTIAMACFEWKNRGYKFAGLSYVVTPRFFMQKTFPAVVAAWGVWIPLVSIIYSLPSLLQVPIFSLALTFWVIIFTWITRQHPKE